MLWSSLKWTFYSDIGTTARIYKAQKGFHFYIKKVYRKETLQKFFDMEITALQLLVNKPHFTKTFEYDYEKRIIYMDYLGEKLSKRNCPANWKEQIEEILNVLKDLDLHLSDFQRNNIVISGNTINLIDFGVIETNKYRRDYLKSTLTFVFENLYD